MAAVSITEAIPSLFRTINNPNANILSRLASFLLLISFFGVLIGYVGKHTFLSENTGDKVMAVSSIILGVVSLLSLIVISLIQLKKAGQANGEGAGSQMAIILFRTFVYFLLPCMLVTGILIVWAYLSHQSGT